MFQKIAKADGENEARMLILVSPVRRTAYHVEARERVISVAHDTRDGAERSLIPRMGTEIKYVVCSHASRSFLAVKVVVTLYTLVTRNEISGANRGE